MRGPKEHNKDVIVWMISLNYFPGLYFLCLLALLLTLTKKAFQVHGSWGLSWKTVKEREKRQVMRNIDFGCPTPGPNTTAQGSLEHPDNKICTPWLRELLTGSGWALAGRRSTSPASCFMQWDDAKNYPTQEKSIAKCMAGQALLKSRVFGEWQKPRSWSRTYLGMDVILGMCSECALSLIAIIHKMQ